MSLNVALIGLGRIGSQYDRERNGVAPESHVGAIMRSPALVLTATCDPDTDRQLRFEQDWNLRVPVFSNQSELLRGNHYDLISVATPTRVQYSTLKGVILSGRPKIIFCEKPFCETLEQAIEIQNLAESNGVRILVNYHRRWDERINKVKSLFDEMGAPCQVEVQYTKGLLNYGSHMINLLEFFFGQIQCVQSANLTPDQAVLSDPSISCRLQFVSGATASLLGIDTLAYELFDLSVYYNETRFSLIAGGYQIKKSSGLNGLFFPGYVHLQEMRDLFPSGPVHGLLEAYREISNYLTSDTELTTNLAETAVRTHRTLNAIYQSARA